MNAAIFLKTFIANNKMSIREASKKSKISHSLLSQFINEKKGISKKTALNLSKTFLLSDSEKKYFLKLVDLNSSSSKLKQKKLNEISQGKFIDLSKENFKEIASWDYMAFLSTLDIESIKYSVKNYANFLDLTTERIQLIFLKLKELNIIKLNEKSKQWYQEKNFIVNKRGLPSRSVRAFHKSILKKAYKSLEDQNTRERIFNSMTMAVNEDQIEEAKNDINHFLMLFEKKFCTDALNKNSVYNLSIQYFKISKNEENII